MGLIPALLVYCLAAPLLDTGNAQEAPVPSPVNCDACPPDSYLTAPCDIAHGLPFTDRVCAACARFACAPIFEVSVGCPNRCVPRAQVAFIPAWSNLSSAALLATNGSDAVVRLAARPGASLVVGLFRSLANRSAGDSELVPGSNSSSNAKAGAAVISLVSWSGAWGTDVDAAISVGTSGGIGNESMESFRFNVTFAEDQLVAWIDLLALQEAANLTSIAAAITLANPDSLQRNIPTPMCNSTALFNQSNSTINATQMDSCNASYGVQFPGSASTTRNYTSQAARVASLLPWRNGGSDTLGPPLLTMSPTVSFLALRITATTGDVALSGVSSSSATVDPAGPAEWAAALSPELNIYLEADAAEADPLFTSATAAGLLMPAPLISTTGGLPISPQAIAGTPIVAVAQAIDLGALRAFALANPDPAPLPYNIGANLAFPDGPTAVTVPCLTALILSQVSEPLLLLTGREVAASGGISRPAFSDRRRARLHAALYWDTLPAFAPLATLTPVSQAVPAVGMPPESTSGGQTLTLSSIPPPADYPGNPGIAMPWFQTVLEATDAARSIGTSAGPIADPRATDATFPAPPVASLVWRLNPPLPLVDFVLGMPFAYPNAAALPNLTAPGAILWLVLSLMDDTSASATTAGVGGGWTPSTTDAPTWGVFMGACSPANTSASPLQAPAFVAVGGRDEMGWLPAQTINSSSDSATLVSLAVRFEVGGRVLNETTVTPSLGQADSMTLSLEGPAQTTYRMAGISSSATLRVQRVAGGGLSSGPVVMRLRTSPTSTPLLTAPLDVNFTWLALGDYAPRFVTLSLAPMGPAVAAALAAGGGSAAVTASLSRIAGNAAALRSASDASIVLCASPATCSGDIVSDYITLQPGGGTSDLGFSNLITTAIAQFDAALVFVVTRADPSGAFAGRSEAVLTIVAPHPFAGSVASAPTRLVWESGAGGPRVVAIALSPSPWTLASNMSAESGSPLQSFNVSASLHVTCGASGSTVSGSAVTARVFVNGSVAQPPAFWTPVDSASPASDAVVALMPSSTSGVASLSVDLTEPLLLSSAQAIWVPVTVYVARFSPSADASRSLRVLVSFALSVEAETFSPLLNAGGSNMSWIQLPTAWVNTSVSMVNSTSTSNVSAAGAMNATETVDTGGRWVTGSWLYWAPGDSTPKPATVLLAVDLWSLGRRRVLPPGCTLTVTASIVSAEGGGAGLNASCSAPGGVSPGYSQLPILLCTVSLPEPAPLINTTATERASPVFCGAPMLRPTVWVDALSLNATRYYSPRRRAAPYNASVVIRRGGGDLSGPASIPISYFGDQSPISGNESLSIVAVQSSWAHFAPGQVTSTAVLTLSAYPLLGMPEANFSVDSAYGPIIFALGQCSPPNASCARQENASAAELTGNACGEWDVSADPNVTSAALYVSPVDVWGSVVYELVGSADSSREQYTPFVVWDSAAVVAAAASQALLAVVMRLVNSSWPLLVPNGSISLSTLQVYPRVDALALLLPPTQAWWVAAPSNATIGLVTSRLAWPSGDYRDSAIAAWADLSDPEAHVAPIADPRGRWLQSTDGNSSSTSFMFRRVWAFCRSDVIVVRSLLGHPAPGDGVVAGSPHQNFNFGAAGLFSGGPGMFYSVLCRPGLVRPPECRSPSFFSPEKAVAAAATAPIINAQVASNPDPSAAGFYSPNISFVWTNLTERIGGVPLSLLRVTIATGTAVPARWAGVRAYAAPGGEAVAQWCDVVAFGGVPTNVTACQAMPREPAVLMNVFEWPAGAFYDDTTAAYTAAAAGWTEIDAYGYSPFWHESSGSGTGRGRPLVLATGPDPWASVNSTAVNTTSGDADVLVVALEVVPLYSADAQDCNASAGRIPVPLSQTIVVRLCRTLVACQAWLVRIARDFCMRVRCSNFAPSPFIVVQAIAPLANVRDHAVVVTHAAATVILSNGAASRHSLIGLSRLGDQSISCQAVVIGLGSPKPTRATASLWIPGWILGTVIFPAGVGLINATLTFKNPDIFGGGLRPELLTNFSGSITLARPAAVTGGIPLCVLGDSIVGMSPVPPGVVTVLTFVPSFAPTATATATSSSSATSTKTASSTATSTSSATSTVSATSTRSVSATQTRTPSFTPSASPPSVSSTPAPHSWGPLELEQVFAGRELRSTVFIATADLLTAGTPQVLPELPAFLRSPLVWSAGDVALAQASWQAGHGQSTTCASSPPWNDTLAWDESDTWNGTLATLTDVSGSMSFLADVWLVDHPGSCADVRQRAITLSPVSLWLPYSAGSGAALARGDCRAGIEGRGSPSESPPSGIILTVSGTSWTFVGCPVASFNVGEAATASCSADSSHRLIMAASTLVMSLNRPVWSAVGGGSGGTYAPSGTSPLRAGYVYVVSVSATISASFEWHAAPLEAALYVYVSPATDAAPAGGAAPPAGVLRNDTSIILTATCAYSPVLCTRAPPTGGRISISPVTGTALVTEFTLGTTSWLDVPRHASVAAPPASLVAAWLSTMLPLPPTAISDLATTAAGFPPAIALVDPCSFDVNSSLTASALNTPVYMMQLAVLASALRYESTVALCIAANAAATRGRVSLSIIDSATTGSASSAPFLFQFRVLAGDIALPTFMPALESDGSGRAVSADVFAQQGALRNSALWPGVPLAPTSTAIILNSTLVAGSAGGQSKNSGGDRTVTIILFALDANAAVGVAYASLVLSPPQLGLSPGLNASDATAAVDSILAASAFVRSAAAVFTPAAATANPFATILAAGALADLLVNGSSTAALDTGAFNSSTLARLAQDNAAVRGELLVSVFAAIVALSGASGAASDGSVALGGNLTLLTSAVRVDDGTVVATSGALLLLSSDAAELTLSSRLVTAAALRLLLQSALPVSSSLASAGTTSRGGSVLVSNSSSLLITTSTPPSLPPFPLATGAMALGVVVNVLAAALQSPALFGSGVVELAPSGTGIDVSTASSLGAALSALTAAALRAAAPGDAALRLSASGGMAGNSTSTAEISSHTPLCNAAISLSAIRSDLRSGNGISLTIDWPLLRCFNASAESSSSTIAPPLPAVVVSNATLWAAMTAQGELPMSVDAFVVEWGESPFPGVPGWSSVAGAANWRAGALNSSDNLSGMGLVDTVISVGLSSSTRPGTQPDALPDRNGGGPDTRTTSVSLQTWAGVEVLVSNASASPVIITLPLTDPHEAEETGGDNATLHSSLALMAVGIAPPLSLLLTCPTQTQLASGAAAPGNPIPVSLTFHRILPFPLNVTLLEVTRVSFVVQVGAAEIPDTASRLPFPAAGGRSLNALRRAPSILQLDHAVEVDSWGLTGLRGASAALGASSRLLSSSATPIEWLDAPPSMSSPGALVNVSAWIAVIGVYCGAATGTQRVVCGPGHEGAVVAFTCPTVAFYPMCASWSKVTRAWSSTGCEAISATSASITCACSHLTDFSARFAAFGDAQNDIFADAALLRSAGVLDQYPHVFIALGVVGVLYFFLLFAGNCADQIQSKYFYRGLAADPEIRLLARLAALRGDHFILDRILDARGGGIIELSLRDGVAVATRAVADLRSMPNLSGRRIVIPLPRAPHVDSTEASGRHRPNPSTPTADATKENGGLHNLSGEDGGGSICSSRSCSPGADPSGAEKPRVGKHTIVRGTEPGFDTGIESMPKAVFETAEPALSAISAAGLAEVTAAHPFSIPDPVSAAIYLRALEQWTGASVTGVRSLADPRLAAAALRLGGDAAAVLVDSSRDESCGAWATKSSTQLSILPAHSPYLAPFSSCCSCCRVSAASAPPLEVNAAQSATRLAALVGGVRAATASLDNGALQWQWTWARAWGLRRFIIQVWLLTLYFQHKYVSFFTKFDPWAPRAQRLTLLCTVLIGHMYWAAFFYAFINGLPGENLPDMTFLEQLFVAVVTQAATLPVLVALAALFRAAGSAEFRWRFPEVWAEIRRRRAAEARFDAMSVAADMLSWNGRFVGPIKAEALKDDEVPAYAVAGAAAATHGQLTPHVDRLTPHIDNPLAIQASPALASTGNGQHERRCDSKVSMPDSLSHHTFEGTAAVVVGSLALAHSGRKPWRPVGGVTRVLDQGLRHPPPHHHGTRPHDAASVRHSPATQESLPLGRAVTSHAFVIPEAMVNLKTASSSARNHGVLSSHHVLPRSLGPPTLPEPEVSPAETAQMRPIPQVSAAASIARTSPLLVILPPSSTCQGSDGDFHASNAAFVGLTIDDAVTEPCRSVRCSTGRSEVDEATQEGASEVVAPVEHVDSPKITGGEDCVGAATPATTMQSRASLPPEETYTDDAAFDFGWIDAPPGLLYSCWPLLWCCGRHPSQKALFVARARASEIMSMQLQRELQERRLAAAANDDSEPRNGDREANSVAVPGDGRGIVSTSKSLTEDDRSMLATDIANPLDAVVLMFWRVWDLVTGAKHALIANDSSVSDSDSSTHDAPGVARREVVGADPTAPAYPGFSITCSDSAAPTTTSLVGRLCLRTRRVDVWFDAGNPARRVGCCGFYPCTLQTVIAYSAAGVYAGYCVFYLLLFGLYQSSQTTRSFALTWAWSQVISIALVQPSIALAIVLWAAVVWPTWVPYLQWLPGLGRLLAGRTTRAVYGGPAAACNSTAHAARRNAAGTGAAALSGRLENLALLRAAGYAAGLSPEAALIAYGTTAVMSAAMGGGARLERRAASRAAERRASCPTSEPEGSASPSIGPEMRPRSVNAVATRGDVVMRRYVLGQLQSAAEQGRRRRGAALQGASTPPRLLAVVGTVLHEARLRHAATLASSHP